MLTKLKETLIDAASFAPGWTGLGVGLYDLGDTVLSDPSDPVTAVEALITGKAKSSKAYVRNRNKVKKIRNCVPEKALFYDGLHGLDWPTWKAADRADKTGLPQGRFTPETLQIADGPHFAQSLKPGEEAFFKFPPGVAGDIIQADGTVTRTGDWVYIKVRDNGTWHGYPRAGKGVIK